MPKSETSVMLVTVVLTVATDNLAIGVVAGVLSAFVLFARRVAHLTTVERLDASDDDGQRVCRVTGELLFDSTDDLVTQLDDSEGPREVVIDLSRAHGWDASSVAALDAIETKYAAHGATVRIVELNEDSSARHGRLSGALGAE